MKQVITLLIATVITLTSFASVKPASFKINIKPNASMQVSLKAAGKVNISWIAATETTTTVYKIEKSVNGSTFKTVAILMGESNGTYSFRESVKEVTGNVTYRVVTIDNNVTINTLTQSVVIL